MSLHEAFSYDPSTGAFRNNLVGKMVLPDEKFIMFNGRHRVVNRVIWKLMTGEEPFKYMHYRDGDETNRIWANIVSNGNSSWKPPSKVTVEQVMERFIPLLWINNGMYTELGDLVRQSLQTLEDSKDGKS